MDGMTPPPDETIERTPIDLAESKQGFLCSLASFEDHAPLCRPKTRRIAACLVGVLGGPEHRMISSIPSAGGMATLHLGGLFNLFGGFGGFGPTPHSFLRLTQHVAAPLQFLRQDIVMIDL